MKPASLRPRVQIFVCCNARASDDPLKSACGAHGLGVYAAVRRAVGAAGRMGDVWVTRTACLGHCPRDGCSVATYPANTQWTDVREADAPALVAHALGAPGEAAAGKRERER